MSLRARALMMLAGVALAGCSDSTGPADAVAVTVTGVIENRNAATIPANARVVVLWGVSSGSPDYSFVFGTGTVSPGGEFSISFDGPPPAAALNNGTLGVGLVLLTSDQSLGEGQLPSNYSFPGLLGFTEDYSIIYRSGTAGIDWAADFPPGYSVGEVQRSNVGFDSFIRVGLDDLRLVVDVIQNLNPPNWT
jgi:hypothetical protein